MKKFLLILLCAPVMAVAQQRSQELFDAGRWRAAHHELLRQRPKADGMGRMKIDFQLAQCTARMGDMDGALEQITRFEERYPGSIYGPELHLTAALCFFDGGKWDRALAEFKKVDNPPPAQRDEYWFKRGYSEFALGKEEAQRTLRQVGVGDWAPHAQYYLAYIDYTQGEYASAKTIFRELQYHPWYAPIAPYYLLQIYFREGNYDYVIRHGGELFEEAAGVRKNEIARVVAEAYFHTGDWQNALKYLEAYRKGGGETGRPEQYMFGYSEFLSGQPQKAIEAFRRVAGPDDALTQNASYHMAASYIELGDKRAAMQSFSVAASSMFDPGITEDATFNYGKLKYELGGGIFSEAINVLSRYVEDYPDSPRLQEATEYLAAAYYNTRDFEAAYKAIKRIPEPDMRLRTALQRITFFRAMDLYNKGAVDQAYAMLGEASQHNLDPKYSALTQFWMGEIMLRRGEGLGAADHLRNYLAVAPADSRESRLSHYNLGYVYFNRKEWVQAKENFDKFVEVYTVRDGYRADALNRLGDIDFARRSFWTAIETYDKAASIDTDERFYAQFRRAMTLGYVDRQARKVESLQAIVDAGRSPYIPDAMYEMGRAYIVQERFGDAAAAMKRYMERYPDGELMPDALADMGLISQNLDNAQAAIEYYKLAVMRAPGSPAAKDAMLALRSIYVNRNDVDSYFAFASQSGAETDMNAAERDSLAYSAASGGGAAGLQSYIDRYPRGAYRAEALFRTAEAYAAAGRTSDAIRNYKELSGMYYNSFTVRGLERLAPLLESAGRTPEAAASWRQLADATQSSSIASHAYSRYLETTVLLGNNTKTEAAADEVSGSGASEEVRRQARYVKAEMLEQRGEKRAAEALYRALATEQQTMAGARATLKVIEAQYAAGDLDGAQGLALGFIESNTPHMTELARACLLLGDIYARRGDAFQARATLQSIIDGYSPATDDGIVAAARERIKKL